MKIASSFKLQGFILAAALGAGFVTPVFAQEQQRSFIVDLNSKKVTDLGTLGGSYSEAHAINAAAQVAGVSTTSAGAHHAFITGPNGVGMTDLNALISLPGGVVLTEARGINNQGQVIAVGMTNAIPEPETYALLLAGLGLMGFMARDRKAA